MDRAWRTPVAIPLCLLSITLAVNAFSLPAEMKEPGVKKGTGMARQAEPFLTARNPTATADQLEMEALSLRLLATPEVQKARQIAAMKVRTLVHGRAPEEAWERFEGVMDEWTLGYVQKAINSDSNYPRVLSHVYSGPYQWFGRKIPGNRAFGGDNPDTLYVMFPIDSFSRFRISGQKFNDKIDAPIQVCSNLSLSSTLGFIAWEDMVFEADGRFVVTIDPQPANGRVNHIQSKPESKFVIIRNTRSDWGATPVAYQVERLDPPMAEPLSFGQLAEKAALYVVDDIPASLYWVAMLDELEANTLPTPFVTGNVGGMWTARMSFGKLHLEDDEAYVITTSTAGARFFNLVLYDYWQYSLDYGNRLTSSNDVQSHQSPDGTMTFVIASQDPGVYNWIDSYGLNHPKIMLRWQQLPPDRNAEPPIIESKVVKLQDLQNYLPRGVKRVTPQERRVQLRERQQAHATRYLDN
jgi:Protein of unknown function (DUF1214)